MNMILRPAGSKILLDNKIIILNMIVCNIVILEVIVVNISQNYQ